MAFWGHTFIFDDIPCSEFGLMVYDFGSQKQEDVLFQVGSVVEDRIPGRYDALTYGLEQNQALEYTLIFGANIESVDNNVSLDRYEIEAIVAWLTGHKTRKWLTIVQDDMESFRYKCLVTELKQITYGNMPWAFSCKISCDSPFAYTFPEETTYTVIDRQIINFFNRSSYNGYFYPKIELDLQLAGGTDFSIENLSDNNRIFEFKNLTTPHIIIDNKNKIITSDSGLNLYDYFNKKFLRLVRGENRLRVTGSGTIKFICEFPVNIGG